MSNLIPTIPFEKFKKLKPFEIKGLKSCELTVDGEYLCTVIIPPKDGGITITDHTRTQAEFLGLSGNSVGGQDLEVLWKQRGNEDASK